MQIMAKSDASLNLHAFKYNFDNIYRNEALKIGLKIKAKKLIFKNFIYQIVYEKKQTLRLFTKGFT